MTTFKAGTALARGDVIHPADGLPIRVVAVTSPAADRALVRFEDGTEIELTSDDVVEIEDE